MKLRTILLSTAMFFGPVGGLPAWAAQGTLECTVAPGVGLIIASSKGVSCTFEQHGMAPEYYTGTMNRFGVDIGMTGETKFMWAVATIGPWVPNALAGDFFGVGAAVAAGAGLSANALVGGNAQSVTLQPLSIGDSSGVDVSAGIGELSLRPLSPAPMPPPPIVVAPPAPKYTRHIHHHYTDNPTYSYDPD